MLYFTLSIYIINLLFVIYLFTKPKYKLSNINYTLLACIAFPLVTPLLFLLIYFDLRFTSKYSLDYQKRILYGELEVFNNGETFFDNVLTSIQSAKHLIIINMFIFNTDQLGLKVLKLLEEKLQQDVKVYILYDYFSKNKKMNMKLFKNYKKLGGELISLMPLFVQKTFNLNHRNHRKMIIIDYLTAYIGGFNIGDEYLSKDSKLGIWSDLEVKITGDVSDLLHITKQDLDLVYPKKDYLKGLIPSEPKKNSPKDHAHPLIISGLEQNRVNSSLFNYLNMIYRAKESIYIMTPYLIINDSLIDALVNASHRGVEIKIIIPSKNDHPLVNNASKGYAYKLLNVNISTYLYSKHAFMHSKMMLIDDEIAVVTSANLDIRSLKYNLELGMIIEDPTILKVLHEQFFEKLEYSKKFDYKDCKFIDKFAMLFSFIY